MSASTSYNNASFSNISATELSQLQYIIPLTPIETLEKALKSNSSIDFAIEELFSVAERDDDRSSPSKYNFWEYYKMRNFSLTK